MIFPMKILSGYLFVYCSSVLSGLIWHEDPLMLRKFLWRLILSRLFGDVCMCSQLTLRSGAFAYVYVALLE